MPNPTDPPRPHLAYDEKLDAAVPSSGMTPATFANRDGTSGPRQAILHVGLGADGFPTGARVEARLEVPAARVWSVVTDLDGYPGRVPMVSRVRREGERVTIQLKFKIALFSVPFEFTVDVRKEDGRWLELKWVAGEPRDILLRFEIDPLDEGRACLLRAEGRLDPTSLGWLAKYFLRHHPEIRFGIVPGVALALFDSVRRGVGA